VAAVIECIQTLTVCKAASERQDYDFNITDEFTEHWRPKEYFDTFDVVRPTVGRHTGFEYTTTGPGVSGLSEPKWPKVIGEEVIDGSLTWVTQAISNDSLRHRIGSVVWSSAAGLTLADQIEEDLPGRQLLKIWATGGTVGETYDRKAVITTQTLAIYEVRLRVSIE